MESTRGIELKPCPRCNISVKINHKCSWDETGLVDLYVVTCEKCGTESSWLPTEKWAAKSWNELYARVLERNKKRFYKKGLWGRIFNRAEEREE